MIGKIRNIHVEKVFAAVLQNHLFSFRFGSLPSDVHFTLVFDEKLEDINLHLTRNVKEKSKPKITIFVANKQMLLANAEVFIQNLINSILQPFDIKEFAEKNNLTVGFLSFKKMESSEVSDSLMDKFKEAIKPHTKRRSKRLKISGDLNSTLELLFGSEKTIDILYDLMEPVSLTNVIPVDGGLLITDTKHFHTVRIDKQWYFIRTDLSIFQFLRTILNRKTAYKIICNTLDAIEKVSVANTYVDTAPYNKPCRLELSEITLPIIDKLKM